MTQASTQVVWPSSVNRHGYLTINGWSRHSAWLHTFMHHYALWGGLTLLAILLIVGYLSARTRPDSVSRVTAAFLTGVATVVALGINQVVSHAVAEPRPYRAFPSALVLVGKANDFSFPSDHAVIAGAFVLGLFLVNRLIGWLALLFGLILCFSRLYVGAHYPSDVVGGFLLGALVCAVVLVVLTRPVRAIAEGLATTALWPVVAPRRVAPRRGSRRARRPAAAGGEASAAPGTPSSEL